MVTRRENISEKAKNISEKVVFHLRRYWELRGLEDDFVGQLAPAVFVSWENNKKLDFTDFQS